MKAIAYITFNGNCRQAMQFYHACFGGELTIQDLAGSEWGGTFPEYMQAFVIQAVLRKDEFVLMGSDLTEDFNLVKGNSVAVFVECKTESDLRNFYAKLVVQAPVCSSVFQNHGKQWTAHLTDRFGVRWVLLAKE